MTDVNNIFLKMPKDLQLEILKFLRIPVNILIASTDFEYCQDYENDDNFRVNSLRQNIADMFFKNTGKEFKYINTKSFNEMNCHHYYNEYVSDLNPVLLNIKEIYANNFPEDCTLSDNPIYNCIKNNDYDFAVLMINVSFSIFYPDEEDEQDESDIVFKGVEIYNDHYDNAKLCYALETFLDKKVVVVAYDKYQPITKNYRDTKNLNVSHSDYYSPYSWDRIKDFYDYYGYDLILPFQLLEMINK